jgi:hypothetical protein
MKTIKSLTIGIFMAAMGTTAMAQLPDWGCSDEVQQQMLEPVSLYQDAIAQYKSSKDTRWLEEAYPYWKQVVANCPKQSKNLYNNGVNIMRVKIGKAKDQAERDALIDELMNMYDVRIATYGEAPKWTAKKALELEELLKEQGLDRYYPLYDQAVKMDGDLEAAYLVKYMEATINYVRAGKAEPTLVVDNYDIASEKLEAELDKYVELNDTVQVNTIHGYIAGVEAAFSPYANCEQLVEIYGKKFEADPENIDLLKKITGILKKKRCIDQPLFFSATENLYRLEPNPATAMLMGQMCLSKKQYNDAIQYLRDAAKDLTGKDKYLAYLYLGHCYNSTNSYSAARKAYLDAAEADHSKGEPYRMIAQLYAATASSASEDNFNGCSAYWAAVDKLNRAKSIDPSEENVKACNALISRYSAHFPKTAAAFMAGLENGKSFRVPGWIGETTTVRTR